MHLISSQINFTINTITYLEHGFLRDHAISLAEQVSCMEQALYMKHMLISVKLQISAPDNTTCINLP